MENEQIRVGVVGCCHGELDEIYKHVKYDEQNSGIKLDLLLICGDFQAVRNYDDLHQMAVPPKFRKLNTFYKYYSGEEVAPVVTVFIGGNHEASGFLQELPYGGWVAPNIYYLGYSGVVQFAGLRIAGISGIHKEHDFNKGHYERPPYDENTKRSCYHIRAVDVFKMHHIKQDLDIFLSHDWPLGIYHHGNMDYLLRKKPFFREEIARNSLGNPYTMGLLATLRPKFWFAAHLHCLFRATVVHRLPHQMQPPRHHLQQGVPPKITEFCALDKALPGRRFFEVFTFPPKQNLNQPKKLHYDPEWLAILRKTDHSVNFGSGYCQLPQAQPSGPSEEEMDVVRTIFDHDLIVPENFTHTAPPMRETDRYPLPFHDECKMYVNPQTERLCQLLGIIHPFKEFALSGTVVAAPFSSCGYHLPTGPSPPKQADPNEINVDDDDEIPEKQSDPNEIKIDNDDDDEIEIPKKQSDPNEIDIDDDEDDETDCGAAKADVDKDFDCRKKDCSDATRSQNKDRHWGQYW